MNYFDILLAKKLRGGGGGDITIKSLNVTQNGTYSEEGVAYSPVKVNVPLPENAYLLKDIPNTPTAIATFTDGSDLPMPKLQVGIEPVQDLHGYDAPWVGGAGKNKANPDLLLNGYTNPNNRKYDDTTMAKTQFVKTEGLSTITISATNGNRCYVCYYNDLPNVGDEALTNVTQVATSLPQTITVDSSYTYVAIQVCYNPNGANVSNVQVESGNQATTFAPYSNICPISGWDEVDVNVSGVNVWDEEWEQGSYSGNGEKVSSSANRIRCKNPIPVKPNTTYYFEKYVYILCQYDKNGDFISFVQLGFDTMDNTSHTYAVGANTYYITWASVQQYGTTYNNDISINYPSTDTSYHAYNGQTYTIDLDGTRYGGKVDLVSGVLTVDRAYVDLGTLNWTKETWGSGIDFYTTLTIAKLPPDDNTKGNIMSSQYKNLTRNEMYNSSDTGISLLQGGALKIRDSRYSEGDATAFKQAMNGVQLVYELATPLTIQLPTTVVKSLEGKNNIFADSGDVLDLSYFGKEE